jgi:hypothetical protein
MTSVSSWKLAEISALKSLISRLGCYRRNFQDEKVELKKSFFGVLLFLLQYIMLLCYRLSLLHFLCNGI